MNFTPEEIAAIIEETVDETTQDLELLLKVMQRISKMFKQTSSRDLNASTMQHPLLMMFNQIYTNTLLLEVSQEHLARIEGKLDNLRSKQHTEQV